jgi:hypothetical protein
MLHSLPSLRSFWLPSLRSFWMTGLPAIGTAA